jgi:alkanesulfonate monooxygenase SsuD/methylene tetrahydromethanopterin reductase-like flavin-dependent oxidoreductase (luciferase family)
MPDSGAGPEVYEAYHSGLPSGVAPRISTNRVLFAASSTEKAWELCGEYLLCQFNGHRKWFSDAGDDDAHGAALTDPSVLSRSHYYVGTPDDIVTSIKASQQEFGYEELIFWARPPGMPIEASTASLELIARHVLPALRES